MNLINKNMNKEDLVLGVVDKDGKPLSVEEDTRREGYTIYKNMDEEMVKAIKSFNLSDEIFSAYSHKNSKVVQELNDHQILCIDEKGEYFTYSYKEIKESSKDNKLEQINKKFNLVDAISKSLGPLYSEDGFIEFVVKKDSIFDNDYTSCSYYEKGLNIDIRNKCIRVLEKNKDNGGSLAFCSLNEDGNIVNRNYNINFTNYIGNKKSTKKELIELIIKEIPDVAYYNYANKWYSDKFMYVFDNERSSRTYDGVPIVILDQIEANGNDTYGGRHDGRFKKPKKCTLVTKEHILQTILPLINDCSYDEKVDLSQYITIVSDDKKVVVSKTNNNKEVNNIRIQETPIIESNYSEVFEISLDDIDLQLTKALHNIKHSIDIPINVTYVHNCLEELLRDCDLPDFSFNKGEKQEDHSNWKGLVKLPYECYFSFEVEEGDACEITWEHSIYSTDIVNLTFLD